MPRTSHKQVLAPPESKFKLKRSMLCPTAHLQREANVVWRLHLPQNACKKLCGLKKRSDHSLTYTFPNSVLAHARGRLLASRKILSGQSRLHDKSVRYNPQTAYSPVDPKKASLHEITVVWRLHVPQCSCKKDSLGTVHFCTLSTRIPQQQN